MGEDDSSNPSGGSTTASSSPSQPTIAELSAQVAQLMQIQTQTSKLILNRDPTKTTPTSTQTKTPTSNQTTTLNSNQTTIPTTITYEASAAQIGIKLDGTNYALWSQVVELYISGKDKLGYINGDLPQPPLTAPTFPRWRTENSIVKGWLINSLEQSLIGNFIRFSTAKAVWDAIATTYYDGTDTSQEDRVYIFFDGLDGRLDKARSDVLHMTPFPTVDQAYAYVRREDVRQAVMMGSSDRATGAGLAAKSTPRSGPPTHAGQPHNSSTAAHLQIQSYATAAAGVGDRSNEKPGQDEYKLKMPEPLVSAFTQMKLHLLLMRKSGSARVSPNLVILCLRKVSAFGRASTCKRTRSVRPWGVGIATEGWPKGMYDGVGILISIVLVVMVTVISHYGQSLQFKDLDREKKRFCSGWVRYNASDNSWYENRMGKIDGNSSEGGEDETPLQLKLNGVATIIGKIGLTFAVLTFLVLAFPKDYH
ncbi:hypothetical protein L3X38_037989 [Prunus dulcis]|uniref:Retrotransposon Copia-like N-terminal domain-containing protein n=1 Tax=Prunus dulcis TaxID=3755 RepID=A0AAD4V5Q6_PRUDU|nr:hypothetical protein L3X38_037989 [Prunus dulcis]